YQAAFTKLYENKSLKTSQIQKLTPQMPKWGFDVVIPVIYTITYIAIP
ncbi:unnamed protein product, partial [marine sediment metagenome]